MIHLKNINITFQQNPVFYEASFIAKDNSITIISGESGSGKSTLINTILFHHDCTYFYNDTDISKLNQDERNIFIQKKIGIVYQLPSFHPSLTIKDHISLFSHLYELKELHKEWAKLLDIHSLLNKYPAMLSGGEKTRAALYLALLKEPEILILDEPTASLDKDTKINVINILKDYAHKYHKTVIISTHDQMMMDEADTLYQIKDLQLQQKQSYVNADNIILQNNLTVHYKALNNYVKIIKKHDKLYDKIIRTFLACTIGFFMIALSLNNSSISQSKEMMNQMASKEFFVYKPINKSKDYSFFTMEYPISKNDLEVINKINGIERIEWRFNTNGDSTSTVFVSDEIYQKEKIDPSSFNEFLSTITSFESKQIKVKKSFVNYMQNTYIDHYNYDNAIAKLYHDDGVYISSDLFTELFDKDTIDPYIQFQLMVPLYDSTGLSKITDEDTKEVIPTNLTSCQYVEVTLPVKGVLTENVLSHENYFEYQIYISQSDLSHYINQFKIAENRTVYYADVTNALYFDTYPKGITPTQTVSQTKWRPNSYSITVKDLEDLDHVVTELKEYGFAVTSNYFQTSNILEAKKAVKQMISLISIILFVIVISLYFFIKFINRKKDNERDRFLEMLGCTKQQKQSFYRKGWLYNWRDQLLIAFLFFFICRFVIMKLNIASIRPDPIIFIMITFLSFVIEFICPMFIKKADKKL